MSADNGTSTKWRENPWVLAIVGGLITNIVWSVLFSSPLGRNAFLKLSGVATSVVDAAFAAAPDERQDSGFTLLALQVMVAIAFILMFPIIDLRLKQRELRRRSQDLLAEVRAYHEPASAQTAAASPPSTLDAEEMVRRTDQLYRGFYASLAWILAVFVQIGFLNVSSSVSGLAHATYSRWYDAAAPCISPAELQGITAQWANVNSRADYDAVLRRLEKAALAKNCRLPPKSL